MNPPVELPDIEADFILRRDAKILERAFELQSAAAGVAQRRAGYFDSRILGDTRTGFVDPLAIRPHLPRHEQCLGALARGGQSALNHQHVDARFFGPQAIHERLE